MPSIITTGSCTWSNREASHCSRRSLLKATKRRETALFDTHNQRGEALLERGEFSFAKT